MIRLETIRLRYKCLKAFKESNFPFPTITFSRHVNLLGTKVGNAMKCKMLKNIYIIKSNFKKKLYNPLE